jgi:D-alanyl-D-alanine endopeptidase (penicillin-binding protein 7)
MKKILLTLIFLPLFAFANSNSVVYNITTQEVIDGSLDSYEMSIASISKLMTVYTVMSSNQDLDEKLTVNVPKHITNTKLSKGMVLTRKDLINLALVSSDNIAAITLSENYPGGQTAFVRKMNESAFVLKMYHTGFVEPTGLSPMNYSSISDLIRLTEAVSYYEIVRNAAQSHTVTGKIQKGKKVVKVKSNPTSTYFGHHGIITIKTGFTNAAGFCITMLVYANNNLYNITVLGAKSKKERQLFVEKSLNKIYNA